MRADYLFFCELSQARCAASERFQSSIGWDVAFAGAIDCGVGLGAVVDCDLDQ